MLNSMLIIFVVAIIVEGAVKAVFSLKPIQQFDEFIEFLPLKLVASFGMGITATIIYQVDIFNILLNAPINWFGMLCTGILVARGANYINMLVKQIFQYKNMLEGAK
jgi:hypothetical protein